MNKLEGAWERVVRRKSVQNLTKDYSVDKLFNLDHTKWRPALLSWFIPLDYFLLIYTPFRFINPRSIIFIDAFSEGVTKDARMEKIQYTNKRLLVFG